MIFHVLFRLLDPCTADTFSLVGEDNPVASLASLTGMAKVIFSTDSFCLTKLKVKGS